MATVIKASGPVHSRDRGAIQFDDLAQRAGQQLEQAHEQAAAIIAQAEQQAHAIRHQAHEQGHAAGLAAAEQLLADKIDKQITTLEPAIRAAVERIEAARADWLVHWESSALRVATAIAARIIRREVEHNPDITLTLVREALELAAGSPDVRLRLHPDDVALLGEQVSRLCEQLSRVGKPQVIGDPSIERGSCRLDTQFGTIDQQFASQLERIEQELS